MRIGLIADTSCDLTPELRKELQVDLVPFKLTVQGYPPFTDDDDMKIEELIAAMSSVKQAVTTACAGPEEFAGHMRRYNECVVISISGKLSGSYNAAMVAKAMVQEESPNKKIHVVDTKSACAGETRAAMEMRSLEKRGLPFEELVEELEKFVAQMESVFVLDDLSNLIKNGRLGKVAGAAATVLGIRPLLRADKEGEIVMVNKLRGTEAALQALVAHVAAGTKNAPAGSVPLALAHGNAPLRAEKVKNMLIKSCPALSEITVVPTKGLSTVYANIGGIVLAY